MGSGQQAPDGGSDDETQPPHAVEHAESLSVGHRVSVVRGGVGVRVFSDRLWW